MTHLRYRLLAEEDSMLYWPNLCKKGKQTPHLGRSAPQLDFSLFHIGLANQQFHFPCQPSGTLSGSLAPRNDTNLVSAFEMIICLRMKETRTESSRRPVKCLRRKVGSGPTL